MTLDADPGSASPRRGSKQGQRTLAAILAAACKIASEEGLEQLSMRRLAAAVGMSKSGLYAHFTSKEELQLATIAHAREVFEAKVAATPASGSDSALAALLDRWLSFFERNDRGATGAGPVSAPTHPQGATLGGQAPAGGYFQSMRTGVRRLMTSQGHPYARFKRAPAILG